MWAIGWRMSWLAVPSVVSWRVVVPLNWIWKTIEFRYLPSPSGMSKVLRDISNTGINWRLYWCQGWLHASIKCRQSFGPFWGPSALGFDQTQVKLISRISRIWYPLSNRSCFLVSDRCGLHGGDISWLVFSSMYILVSSAVMLVGKWDFSCGTFCIPG